MQTDSKEKSICINCSITTCIPMLNTYISIIVALSSWYSYIFLFKFDKRVVSISWSAGERARKLAKICCEAKLIVAHSIWSNLCVSFDLDRTTWVSDQGVHVRLSECASAAAAASNRLLLLAALVSQQQRIEAGHNNCLRMAVLMLYCLYALCLYFCRCASLCCCAAVVCCCLFAVAASFD